MVNWVLLYWRCVEYDMVCSIHFHSRQLHENHGGCFVNPVIEYWMLEGVLINSRWKSA
jgi:hypothetical protein